MATTQKAAATKSTPNAVKAAAGSKGGKAAADKPKARSVPAGTLSGPKGRNMAKQEAAPEVTPEQRRAEDKQQMDNAKAQFAPSEMAAPAAHEPQLAAQQETDEQRKQREFMEGVAKLAEAMGVPLPALNAQQPAKGQRAPRADREQRNGITRPASGTTTGEIWDIADKISFDHGGKPALIAEVRQHPNLKQTNEHTIKTQYARWRAFHGIKGRSQTVRAPDSPEGRDEGIEQAWGRRATDVDRRAQPQEDAQQ